MFELGLRLKQQLRWNATQRDAYDARVTAEAARVAAMRKQEFMAAPWSIERIEAVWERLNELETRVPFLEREVKELTEALESQW